MITSAHALNQLFAALSAKGDSTERFLTLAAKQLKLEGNDSEVRALKYIYDLVARIRDDIEALPFDAETKAQVRKSFEPFKPLLSFNFFNHDMQNARTNILHPNNLVGLTNLQAFLWNRGRSVIPQPELAEIAAELREYILEINSLNLPAHVKKVLHRRVEQVASMLENYFFYGGEAIQEELEALIGSIVSRSEATDDTARGFLRKLASQAARAMKALSATDSNLGIALSVLEKGKKLLSFLSPEDKASNS